jgi:succinate-semialdehyde dehydrogenase/glutarate-semialdehyde dehydrogenase
MPLETSMTAAHGSSRTFPNVQLHIGGVWRHAADDGQLPIHDPATGERIGSVSRATRSDLAEAVEAADKGFRVWSNTPPFARSDLMRRVAVLLRERKEHIAWLLTREQGKPISQAVGEVEGSADLIDWLAEEGRRSFGRTIPSRALNVTQMTIKIPVGPVAAFSPWNYPVYTATAKLAAALAAGCSVIVKAPEETPASPAALIQAFLDAGLPPGVVNLLYGVPAEISEYLIAHPAIAKISFTGSTVVGKHLASLAGMHMKRSTMELGGHSPVLIFDDADIDHAVTALIKNKFTNAGQVCTSPTRFLIEETVADEFIEKFTAAARSLQVGNGLDPAVDMGPLANSRRPAALRSLVDDALSHRAKLITGGEHIDGPGNFFPPTLLADVPLSARIMSEEPFGPVVLLNRFRKLDEAIDEANRLPYGLASYAFTRSTSTSHAVGTRLIAGMTTINHCGLGNPEVPFGGVRDSGYGTEGGPDAIEPFLISKFITSAA